MSWWWRTAHLDFFPPRHLAPLPLAVLTCTVSTSEPQGSPRDTGGGGQRAEPGAPAQRGHQGGSKGGGTRTSGGPVLLELGDPAVQPELEHRDLHGCARRGGKWPRAVTHWRCGCGWRASLGRAHDSKGEISQCGGHLHEFDLAVRR